MPAAFDRRTRHLDGLGDDIREVDPFAFQLDFPTRDPRHVEQVIDERHHVVDLPFDNRALALGARLVAQTHQLQRRQNRRQRVSQFVAEHGQEFVFGPVGRFGVAPGVRQLGHVERDDRDARHLRRVIEQRLIHKIEERLLRGAALTLDHDANGTALEWLAGLIHAVEQLVDALPLELRKRVSNGFAFDRPSADEIEVPAVGKFKHVRCALQRGDADRRMREDTGQPHRLRFFQRSQFGANELRVDSRDQLARGERFHQVVIGAGVEPVNARLLARAR